MHHFTLMAALLAQGVVCVEAMAEERLAAIPTAFARNDGQFDARALFAARSGGATLFITAGGFAVDFGGVERRALVEFEFEGARTDATSAGEGELPWRQNYLVGADRAHWRSGVPVFGAVRAGALYEGVDAVYRAGANGLEYDLDCADPAAAEAAIVRVAGHERLRLDADGTLCVDTAAGTIQQSPPRAFAQDAAGRRVAVDCRFLLLDGERFAFAVGATDPCRRVVIDPALAYSTYLGGSGDDEARGIAVNAAGEAFVVGFTYSNNFPTTPGAYDVTHGSGSDAFVVKMNAAGTAPIYATFLGGGLSADSAEDVAIDAAGNAYVTGNAIAPSAPFASDFPVTAGAFDTTPAGAGNLDGFVAKLNASGSALVYSTFYGSGFLHSNTGIAVGADGTAYIVGSTGGSLPVSVGAFDTTFGGGPFSTDAFAARLNSTGTALLYGTYLGGSAGELAYDAALGAGGVLHVVGSTSSPDFPGTAGTLDPTPNGGFLTALNSSGTGLVLSTGLGATNGIGGVALDSLGRICVAGTAGAGFAATAGAFDTSFNGGASDAIAMALNSSATAVHYATYLGGSGDDTASAVAADGRGNAHVLCRTTSADFPTTAGAPDAALGGSADAAIVKLSAGGDTLLYATFHGGSGAESTAGGIGTGPGIAVDASEASYAGSVSDSADLPVTAGAFDTTANGADDGFVVKAKTRTCAANALSSTYGAGKPGTNGVPLLDSVNLPYVPSTTSIRVTNGRPFTPSTLFVGLAPLAAAFDGGQLLVNPTFIIALPPFDAAGSITIPGVLGDDPSLCGIAVYHQVMFGDPGAAGFYHTAQTNGLVRTLGS